MKNRTVLLLFTLFMIISFAMSIASLLTPDWVHTESTLNNTFVLTQLFQGVAHGSLDKPCLKISINGTEISNNCPFLNPSDVPNGAQRGVYGLLVSGIVFSFLAILCGLLTICYPTVIQPTKSFMFISGKFPLPHIYRHSNETEIGERKKRKKKEKETERDRRILLNCFCFTYSCYYH